MASDLTGAEEAYVRYKKVWLKFRLKKYFITNKNIEFLSIYEMEMMNDLLSSKQQLQQLVYLLVLLLI